MLKDLREIVGELVDNRDLLREFTARDIRIRYKQAVMGFGWAILMPAVIVLAGILVRYAMARLSGTQLVVEEIGGMAVKAVPWAFFVGALGFSVNSLTGNMVLVGKVYFPREALPLSSVFAQSFDALVGSIALLLFLPLLGMQFTIQLLWVPVIAAVLLVFTAATALFLSCANLFFRDVKYLVQVFLAFGIFVTPVFFEPAMFGAAGAQLMMLNPLAPMLEGARLAVVEGHNLLLPLVASGAAGEAIQVWSPWHLAYSGVWAGTGLVGSMLLFHRMEFVFAEYV